MGLDRGTQVFKQDGSPQTSLPRAHFPLPSSTLERLVPVFQWLNHANVSTFIPSLNHWCPCRRELHCIFSLSCSFVTVTVMLGYIQAGGGHGALREGARGALREGARGHSGRGHRVHSGGGGGARGAPPPPPNPPPPPLERSA